MALAEPETPHRSLLLTALALLLSLELAGKVGPDHRLTGSAGAFLNSACLFLIYMSFS